MLEKYLKKPSGFFLVNMKEGDDTLKWLRSHLSRLKKPPLIKIVEIENLFEECSSFSLFEEKLLVIPGSEKLKKADVEMISTNPSAILFLSSGMRSTNALYKWLEPQKVVLDLSLETKVQREKRLTREVIDIATYYGKKMSAETAGYLLSIVPADFDLLTQELLKLSCFVGEREEITAKDIASITANTKEESLFRFCDALLAKKADIALHIARKLLNENSSLFPLLRGVRTQIQVELQVASLLATSPHAAADIQQLFPYMKGKILEIHMQTAQRFGLKALKQALLSIDFIDFLAKNGVEEEELLLDILIAKVTHV